jgi:hypothetical protein
LRKLIVLGAWALAAIPAQPATFEKDVSPLLRKYCYTCHGNGAKSGGVALDSYKSADAVDKDPLTWDTVLTRVRAHEMPPQTVKLQPSDAERQAIGKWIETELARHTMARPALIRRLNRAEYNNTIRDLVGVDFHPADDFPADNSGFGFDNIGEVLALPPVLMEKYLAAANTVLDKAIATEAIPSRVRRSKANLMEMGFNADGDRGDGWMPLTALEEDCLAVSMPVAGGDYIIRVQAFGKARGTSADPIILTGMLDNSVTNEWAITATEQAPGIYEARIGVPEGKHRFVVLNHRIRGGKNELQMRNGRIGAQQTGTIWVKWVEIEGPVAGVTTRYPASSLAATREAGKLREIATSFKVSKGGEYVLRAEAYAQQAGTDPARMEFRMDGKPVKTFDVLAPADMTPIAGQQVFSTELLKAQPRVYEFHVTLPPGERRFSAAFINPLEDPENKNPNLRDRNLFVNYLEVAALSEPSPIPPMPEPMRRLFTDRSNPRRMVSEFARRAWRRPLQSNEVDGLMTLYTTARNSGASFENAIKQPMKAVLVSPYFLFQAADPSSEFALASRLSYFLWSSMPDDELLGLAERGALRPNLDAQVKRMLASPKSHALAENFAGQWLEIRNLQFLAPDKKMFPDFDEGLRAAMRTETEMFFDSMVHEDRGILDFLTADYTFVNERLAQYYGLAGVKGAEFRKVSLAGTPRRGVLTQASVLTLTSNPTRTSPVERGKWVLENLLGTPPPPPPPDVPALPEGDQRKASTLRQEMEQHRANAVCASCHARMDPIGFGLENFDATGKYRAEEGGAPIDASGQLNSGEQFTGPAQLAAILAGAKRDLFVRCLTEKLLIYALGRGLEYSDRAATGQIATAVQPERYKFSTLILNVVKSAPFEQRRAPAQ